VHKVSCFFIATLAIIAIGASIGTYYFYTRSNELRGENGILREVVSIYIDSDERARAGLLEAERIIKRMAERDRKAAELARQGLELIYGKQKATR
jgi:hypothetical protein